MKISVIIPVYNRLKQLRRALESVYSQKSPAEEVIVVDDGSAVDIKASLGNEFPQTTFIRISHAGVSRARNVGVSQSNYDWIAFLDSDDEWHADKLRDQARQLNASGLMLCHTNEIWVRKGVRVNPHHKHKKYGGWIFQRCLPLCLISPSSVIISKSFFLQTGGFDETLPACEDYDLWLRMTSKVEVDYIDKPLINKYGGHDDQLSHQYWGMDRFRIYAMEKLYQQGRLTDDQVILLLDELIKKSKIFANGAEKRRNHTLHKQYAQKAQRYAQRLSDLMS